MQPERVESGRFFGGWGVVARGWRGTAHERGGKSGGGRVRLVERLESWSGSFGRGGWAGVEDDPRHPCDVPGSFCRSLADASGWQEEWVVGFDLSRHLGWGRRRPQAPGWVGPGSFGRDGWAGVEDDPRHPWVRSVERLESWSGSFGREAGVVVGFVRSRGWSRRRVRLVGAGWLGLRRPEAPVSGSFCWEGCWSHVGVSEGHGARGVWPYVEYREEGLGLFPNLGMGLDGGWEGRDNRWGCAGGAGRGKL